MSADSDSPSAGGPRFFEAAGLELAEDDPRIWPATWKAIRAAGFEKPEKIGRQAEGATAIVLRAKKAGEPRRVALKIVLDPRDERAMKQFRQERHVLCQEGLPEAVVRYFGCLEGDDHQPVLLLEYVHGRKLGEWVKAGGHSPERRLELVRELFALVAELRARNLYWCDISPNNLLIDGQERLRLIDAGQAGSVDIRSEHSITAGKVRGTDDYAPQAVLRGERKPEPRDDVRATARVAFLVLTGASWDVKRSRDGARELADAGVPSALARIVVSALARAEDDEKKARAQANAGLAQAVRRECEAWFAARDRRRRRRAILAWAVPLTILLGGLASWGWWQVEVERGAADARTVTVLERELGDSPNRGHPAVRTARETIRALRADWERATRARAPEASELRDRLLQALRSALQLSHEIEAIAPLREALGQQLATLPLVRSCPSIAAREQELASRFQALASSMDRGDLGETSAGLRQLQTELALLAKSNASAQQAEQARLAWERLERGVADRLRALDGFRVCERRAAEARRLWTAGQFTDASGPGAITEFGQVRAQLEAFLTLEETPEERRHRLTLDASVVEDLELKNAGLQTELAGARERLDALQQVIARAEQERAPLIAERDRLARERDRLIEDLAKATSGRDDLQRELEVARAEWERERGLSTEHAEAAKQRIESLEQALAEAEASALVAARTAREEAAVRKVSPPGQRIEASHGIVMLPVAAGSYTIGSPADESGRDDDEQQHRVTLTRDYWLAETEVTQAQWRAVMETAPWSGQPSTKDGASMAASCMTWTEAVEFCAKLTAAERQAGRLPEGYVYCLPTEAEWEVACRAGSAAAYCFGGDAGRLGEYAVFAGAREGDYAHAVKGGRKPNAWGFYDLHGNVWEWCADAWGQDAWSDGAEDPLGKSGSRRVDRGGCWCSSARGCRSAYRSANEPGFRWYGLGFRPALAARSVR